MRRAMLAGLAAHVVGFAAAAGPPPLRWFDEYNTLDGGSSVCADVTILPDGGVVAVGWSPVSGQATNWMIRRYATSRVPVWTRVYSGSGNSEDHARGVAADSAGNIVVCGYEAPSGMANRWMVRKYTGDGQVIWTRTEPGVGQGSTATKVALDAAGNAIVTGFAFASSGGNSDIVTRKYDAGGNLMWTAVWAGPTSLSDQAHAVAVDASGCAYVAGQVHTPTPDLDGLLIKYNASGAVLWSRSYQGPGVYSEWWEGVALLPGGDPIVAGTEDRVAIDWLVARYDASTGALVWTRSFNAPGNGADLAHDVALQSDGTILVLGEIHDPFSFPLQRPRVRALSADGVWLWQMFVVQPPLGLDDAIDWGIATGSGDDFALGGHVGSSWVARMYQAVPPVISFEAAVAYPNPFRPGNGDVIMRIAGVDRGAIVKVFSSRGRLVRTLTAGESGVAPWDGKTDGGEAAGSGVYTAVGTREGRRQTVRFVLQR